MTLLGRFVLLVALSALCPGGGREVSVATPDEATAAGEVRLRKLHLVRPDLIPYPISFEVYA